MAPCGPCYVALGSNMGDRLRFLSRALQRIRSLEGVQLKRTSSLYWTAPQYVTDQPAFLNSVVELQLSSARLAALPGLLADFKAIEEDLGRKQGGVRRGPRVVDLDIVAVGEEQVTAVDCKYPLVVPHERMHERDFVLVPLEELAPSWRHPAQQGRPSVREMVSTLQARSPPGEADSAGGPRGAPDGAAGPSWPVQVIPGAAGLQGRVDGALWMRGKCTLVMGILNVTPDSFSDGGDHARVEDAVASARDMCSGGAHIIDVGGESTRPGAAEVPVQEEIGRVLPVIRALREAKLDVTISVDTRKAAVARAAVEAGADWINDVTAGAFDPQMLPTAAELLAPIVLMHMRGSPKTMNSEAVYTSVVDEVCKDLQQRRREAMDAGVPAWNIILDPGIGFAKNMDHNLTILRRCADVVRHLEPSPVLVGASRKRFLSTILREPDAKRLVLGNAAWAAAAVAGRADVLRVHDVKEVAQAARVSDFIHRGGSEGSPCTKAAAGGTFCE